MASCMHCIIVQAVAAMPSQATGTAVQVVSVRFAPPPKSRVLNTDGDDYKA